MHWRLVAAVFVFACAVVDLLPHHGAPYFRYTGSDPAYAVWNLGWPVALFIYDPRSGFHVGPFAYIMLPFQLLVVALVLVVMALKWLHGRSMRTATASGSAGK